jgi:hypothetical protein
MRRTPALTLVAAVSLAAGSAADAQTPPTTFRTPGAQALELRYGNGRAVVSRRGSLNMRIVNGRIRIVDLPGGARPNRQCNRRGIRISSVAMEYRGRDVRCLVWGDSRPWQAIMRGRGIFASGKALGSLTLDGVNAGARGIYKIGSREFRRWPRAPRTFVLRS